MRPDQCIACQGRDLYHTTIDIESNSGIVIRLGLSGKVLARCSICLACGTIATYLDSSELDKVRVWKKKKKKKVSIKASNDAGEREPITKSGRKHGVDDHRSRKP
jgi:hypothetical protein